jgi:AcrR family transcriptional regulator
MSARPRTVPDQHIIAAAMRAMSRLGPTRLTLAEVAREAGLSAATLVQRFGSKRGLMQALWADALTGIEACFDMLRPAHPSPLDALIAAATEMPRHTRSPEEMANHLAFLQIDVSDPEFHPYLLEMSQRTEAGYRALLDEAIVAGEIIKTDTALLARAVGAISGGSLIGWAVFREGTAEAWVRRDLETLLGPYRPKEKAPAARARGRRATPRQRRPRARASGVGPREHT